jgi:hypothetical protein
LLKALVTVGINDEDGGGLRFVYLFWVVSPPDSKVVLEVFSNLGHLGAEFVEVVVSCFHVVVEVEEGLDGSVGCFGLSESFVFVDVHLVLGKVLERREVVGIHVVLGADWIKNRVELSFLKFNGSCLGSKKCTGEGFHI